MSIGDNSRKYETMLGRTCETSYCLEVSLHEKGPLVQRFHISFTHTHKHTRRSSIPVFPCCRSTIRNPKSIHTRGRRSLSQDAYRRNSRRFLQTTRGDLTQGGRKSPLRERINQGLNTRSGQALLTQIIIPLEVSGIALSHSKTLFILLFFVATIRKVVMASLSLDQ